MVRRLPNADCELDLDGWGRGDEEEGAGATVVMAGGQLQMRAYLLSQGEMSPCPNLNMWLFLEAEHLEGLSLVGQGVCQKFAGMKLFSSSPL